MLISPCRRLSLLALAVGIGCGNGGARSLDGGTLGGAGGAQATGGGLGAGGVTSTGGILSDGGVVGPAVDAGPLGAAVGSLELYGTFHAMGVIATLPAGSDSNGNAVANVDCRLTGSSRLRRGIPPDPNWADDVHWQPVLARARPELRRTSAL